ncbi:MAG: adenylate synthase [Porticoccaceae bacterium]|nr:adenylate synthase [Porticoccaceae bacterium]
MITDFLSKFFLARSTRWKSKEQICEWQQSSFVRLKKMTLTKSEFYFDYCDKDFSEFPVIDKSIHVANFNTINTRNLDWKVATDIALRSEKSRDFENYYRGFSVGLSTGTSGNKGIFVLSKRERIQWAGYVLGKMLPLDFRVHRIALILRSNSPLYESIGFSFFLRFQFFDPINGIATIIPDLESFKPTILIAPSSILDLLSQLKIKIYPVKIISVAEVLNEDQESRIENYFEVKVEQIYQCTEGFLAASCRFGNLHINEDLVIVEKQWIDKDRKRYSPIITDLNRTVQPVVRYLLDDVLIHDSKKCPCGSPMSRIGSIEGRCDDILRLYNGAAYKNIFPDFIRIAIICHCSEIVDYRVEQVQSNHLIIYLSPLNRVTKNGVLVGLAELWSELSVIPPKVRFRPLEPIEWMAKKRRVLRRWSED